MLIELDGFSLSDLDDSDEFSLTSESDETRADIALKERWLILIDAKSESEQKRLLARFLSEKLDCRALIS